MDETIEPTKTGGMNPLIIVAAIAIVGVVAYMLFLNQPATTTTTDTTIEETGIPIEQPTTGIVEDTEDKMMADSDVVTIEMEAGAFYYTPKEIRVKEGQTVRINFKAVDMMHDINIDELQVDGPIVKSGESTTVKFIASQSGEFEYYCSVGQHRANGQVGKLIVE